MLLKHLNEMSDPYDVAVVDERFISVKQRVRHSIDMLTPLKYYQEES